LIRGGINVSKPIQKEVDIKATPQRVYKALLDAKQFSAFTGAPAEIEGEAGGAFSCFGGFISGRNVELDVNRRIVQAWRVKIWPEGFYSLVTFDLKPVGAGTRLSMEHKGFPDDMRAHLNGEMPDGGWNRQYLDPLQKYFS
jgi:activator of HSP90 ATPase